MFNVLFNFLLFYSVKMSSIFRFPEMRDDVYYSCVPGSSQQDTVPEARTEGTPEASGASSGGEYVYFNRRFRMFF